MNALVRTLIVDALAWIMVFVSVVGLIFLAVNISGRNREVNRSQNAHADTEEFDMNESQEKRRQKQEGEGDNI